MDEELKSGVVGVDGIFENFNTLKEKIFDCKDLDKDAVINGVKIFANVMDLAYKGEYDKVFTIIKNSDYDRIEGLIKMLLTHINNRTDEFYEMIQNIANLSNTLNKDYLLEMYFETGDEKGIITCVTSGVAVETINKIIENCEFMIECANNTEEKELYRRILDHLKT